MNKKLLFLIAFLEGGLVMLLEILMPLIITPVVGKSVIVWSVLISVSVGALAIGYYLGGNYLSKTNKNKTLVDLFILNSSLLLLGWLLYAYQNYSTSIHLESYSWLLVTVILFFPLIIFGSTTPIIIGIFNNQDVGKVYSVSTFGGILFCITTGFFLVPEIGISKTLLAAIFITTSIPLLIFLNQKNFNKSTYTFMLLACIVLLFFSNKFLSKYESKGNVTIVEHTEGIDGQLMVADINYENGVEERLLLVNRTTQTWINKLTQFSIWSYNGLISSLTSVYPEHSNSLLMGLGGGVIARHLIDFNAHNVDVVELDNRIIEISKNYYGLSKYPQINYFNDDARRFMKSSNKKYDYIVMDIYNGEFIPSHTLSKEALVDLENILNENGMVFINFNGFLTGKEGKAGRCLIKTVLESNFKLQIFATEEEGEDFRNIIYVLYKNEPDWSKIQYKSLYNGIEYDMDKYKIDINAIDLKDDIEITDNFPLLEYYGRHAANKWREASKYYYLMKFKEENNIIITK